MDARVRVFPSSHNDIGATHNFGLLQAKGRWIYFVDADDQLQPQCLEFAIQSPLGKQVQMVSWGTRDLQESLLLKNNLLEICCW